MNRSQETHTIGTLAKAAGVNVETIRFYQRKGLLPEPARAHGSIRRYAEDELARLRFIKSAQRLGFTLEEIAQLLRLEDGARCGEARVLAEEKLADVRARLKDLRHIETALATLIRGCHSTKATVSCPLIEALQKA